MKRAAMILAVFCALSILGFSASSAEEKAGKTVSPKLLDYDIAAEKLGERDSVKAARTKQMIANTISYIKKNGLDKAVKAINDPANREHGKFVDGEFYIWILETNYVNTALVLAHAMNKTLLGKEFYNIRDPEGRYFLRDVVRLSSFKDEGWFAYKWAHPTKKKAIPKVSYFQKYESYLVICGYYAE